MIINSTNGAGRFPVIRPADGSSVNRGSSERAKSAEPFGTVLRGKTDTVEFSRRTPTSSGCDLKETKAGILDGINKDAEPKTLEILKSLTSSGNYRINPDELARILAE